MEIESDRQVSATSINYDDQPIVQAQIDGVDYRVDTDYGGDSCGCPQFVVSPSPEIQLDSTAY